MSAAEAPAAGKKFPLKAANNAEWESQCREVAAGQLGQRVAASLNGKRYTTWRICVEKKRTDLARMLGATLPLTQMPEDIKTKVVEFLPKTPAPEVGSCKAAADFQTEIKARKIAAAEKWAGLIVAELGKEVAESVWDVECRFNEEWLTEEMAGETWSVVVGSPFYQSWFDLEELHTKLMDLGYTVDASRVGGYLSVRLEA